MKKRFVRAALMACLLGSAAAIAVTAPLTPAIAKSSGPSVSSAVAKLLKPAQDAMNAKDFAGAMVLLKQAQALPDQTEYDTYSINNFIANASIALNDYATADTAYEAMADSPALPDAEKSATLHNAALLANQAKHYDKAIKYAQAYLALGGEQDPAVIATLAQAYYNTNDFASAAATAQKAIDATPAGQAPNRAALEIKLSAQIKDKKQDDAMKTLEQIVTYYDDPEEWGQLVDVSLGVKGIKDFEALHLYRLRFLAKAPGHSEDFTVAASLALAANYPVEADNILSTGGSNVERNAKNNALIADARNRANIDRKTIDSFVKTAQGAASGELDLKAAETLYGYGRYADAEAAARRALQKGGAKMSSADANMVLGQSLLRQGKTADAVTAFNAISNPSPGMARAQHLWLLYATRKVTP